MRTLIITLMILISTFCFAEDITTMYFPPAVSVVQIDITQAWVSTGVMIAVDDTIVIKVDGIAATDGKTWPNTFRWVGPEGGEGPAGPNSPVPNGTVFAVIGKIGENGTPFVVGRNLIFKSNIEGELFLGNNDEIFWDNEGYFIGYVFKVKNGVTVLNKPNNVIQDAQLYQNYPNPFNPVTSISFVTDKVENVEITIYDVLGRSVKSLKNETMSIGSHTVIWDGKNDMGNSMSSGTYYYQIKVGDFVQSKKMIMMK